MKIRKLMIIQMFLMVCQMHIILKILVMIVNKKFLILIFMIQEIERVLITPQMIF